MNVTTSNDACCDRAKRDSRRPTPNENRYRAYPIPSIVDNITSALPSFGVPESTKSARPAPPTPVPTSPATASSSWWPSSSSSSSSTSSSAPPPAALPVPPSASSGSSKSWRSYLPSDPAFVGVLSGTAAVGLTLGAVWGYRRYGRRIRNADSVTSGMLEKKVWIRGVVTSVGDGDNFRLFHTPLLYRFPFKIRTIPSTTKELKNETLHIRISGVDAPEAAHFGNPAQPHSAESLDWLKKTVLGRRMRCQLLRKDQYNRIVAVPYISRWIFRDRPLPLMMLKEGMAVVYTSGGGEYGSWGLEHMQAVEAEAKRAKRGLWRLKKFEHPAEYKKRIKAGEEATIGVEEVRKGERTGLWGFINRLIGR